MLNLVFADLFRLTKSKSTLVFWGVMVGIFALAISFINTGMNIITYSIMLTTSLAVGSIAISIISLNRVYCDELSSGSIHQLFSKTPNKIAYLFGKIIVLAIYVFVNYLVLGLIFIIGISTLVTVKDGNISNVIDIGNLIRTGLFAYLATIVYVVIAQTILILTKKTTISIMFISLFSTVFIDGILELLANAITPLSYLKPYFYPTQFQNLIAGVGSPRFFLVLSLIYLTVNVVFQIVFLSKREFAIE